MCNDEMAEVLNLPIGTVMSRLFYGRKKLQSILRPIYNHIYKTRQPSMPCRHAYRLLNQENKTEEREAVYYLVLV